VENTKEKEKHNPRLYTIHSQKGGVGKTSVSIAIAGFANVFHNKIALIIDADLTGASLFDIRGWAENEKPKYFNDLILASPPEFAEYTRDRFHKSERNSPSRIREFCKTIPNCDGIFYMPASPILDDVLKIVPLISQEDFLDFFKLRLEDIIATALSDQFDVIIIDHPPGLFGISTASLSIVLDQENDLKHIESHEIAKHALFITSPDSADYKALLPSFSRILEKKSVIAEIKNIGGSVDVILNKVSSARKRFDPPFEYRKILNDAKEFIDDRKVSPLLIEFLWRRAKEIGALACGYISDFDMAEILPTIQKLKIEKDRKEIIYTGMEGWCMQLARSINLWDDEGVQQQIREVKQDEKKNSG